MCRSQDLSGYLQAIWFYLFFTWLRVFEYDFQVKVDDYISEVSPLVDSDMC